MPINLSQHIATHFHQLYNGGNWPGTAVKDVLKDVTREEAILSVHGLNSILALTYHIYYYVKVAIPVLEGGELSAHDKFSYDHPVIQSEPEWQEFLTTVYDASDRFEKLVSEIPATQWEQPFTDEKYGTYFRNMLGTIEHTYYHLGQIALIKKIIRNK